MITCHNIITYPDPLYQDKQVQRSLKSGEIK